MDLRLMEAQATAEERSAVDSVLGQQPDIGSVQEQYLIGGAAIRARRDLLLPALWGLQSEIGWISPGGLNYVCERLTVPPAEAYGVASFYALLALKEQPGRLTHVCDDLVCARFGTEDLIEELEAAGHAVERSPCLGRCEQAPAALIQRAGQDDVSVAPASIEAVAAALPQRSSFPAQAGEGKLLRRIGRVDPASLDDYQGAGGYQALARAVELGSERVTQEVKESGLVGRGGAAFPAGIKWEAVSRASQPERYVICNADESEPGTFKDRVLIENDPFAVLEAMTIAGYATGAETGYFYVRGEYPEAQAAMESAAEAARSAGLLGTDVIGAGFAFDIVVRRGAGAYICGEETALMNSIEGYRGEPRNKPPFPTQAGLFGQPTLINNVETLVNVLDIVLEGGEAFAKTGTKHSTGTKLFCLTGVPRPGVYEVEFGTTLAELIGLGGGDAATLTTVLLGGAAGSFVSPEQFDVPLTFEGTREAGLFLGSGAVIAIDHSIEIMDVLRRVAAFFRDESCGQCVPCRLGTVRQEEALARAANGSTFADEAPLLKDITRAMTDASICGLGQTAGVAILSAIELGLVGDRR